MESWVWKMALAEFGHDGLADWLRQSHKTLQWRRGDSYVLLPLEQFGDAVFDVIRAVPELAQMHLDDRLLIPSQLRRHLLNTLVQALPVNKLEEPLLELRLALDTGL